MKVEAAIAAWRRWMTAAGRSPDTIALRVAHITLVLRDMQVADPWQVTTDQLVLFLASRSWKPNTRRSYRASLRVFYRWARDAGHILVSPADLIPTTKLPRSKPRPVPEQRYHAALATTTNRALAIGIRLGGQCGLRRAEISRVRREDIVPDLVGYAVRVTGKGGHERMVPLPDKLADALLAQPEGWLFPSDRRPGQPIRPGTLARWISEALGGGHTTHSLRHRCGTVALHRNGGNLRAVQELLGHAKPETTALLHARPRLRRTCRHGSSCLKVDPWPSARLYSRVMSEVAATAGGPAHIGTRRADPTYAWCLALLPLAIVLVAWLAPGVYAGSANQSLSGWPWFATIAVSIVLARLDQQKLNAAGFHVPGGSVFLVPVYLFMRAKITGTTVAVPVTWCATFLFSVLALFTFASVYSYSGTAVGSDISQQLQQRSGGAGITVTCPNMAGHNGAVFSCTAADRQGQTALVTVTLSSSGYVWRLG